MKYVHTARKSLTQILCNQREGEEKRKRKVKLLIHFIYYLQILLGNNIMEV